MNCCTALLLLALNLPSPRPESMVVARDTPTQTDGGRISKLRASEVVQLLATEGARVRVEAANGEHWVTDKLLQATDFQPVKAWQGSVRVHVYAPSYDSTQTYFIRRDGSFNAYLDINFEPGPSHWTGRLYRSGDVVWARRDDARTFEQWELFQARLGDELCWLSQYEDPCSCIGAGGRALSCDAAPKPTAEVQLRPGPGDPGPPVCGPMLVLGQTAEPLGVRSGPAAEFPKNDALPKGHRVWACASDPSVSWLSVVYAPTGSSADCSRFAEAPPAGTQGPAWCRSGWVSADEVRDEVVSCPAGG